MITVTIFPAPETASTNIQLWQFTTNSISCMVRNYLNILLVTHARGLILWRQASRICEWKSSNSEIV